MAKSRGRKFAEITSPTSGVFDLTSVPTITNAKLQNSAMTLAGSSVSLGGTGVADTDALSEGSSNLYFTDARVQTFLGGGTLAGNIVVPDNRSIYVGSSSDFRIIHNTTNTQLTNATGALQITSNGGVTVAGAATFSTSITVEKSGADSLIDILGDASNDAILNLRSNAGAITTEGFQIWYDNNVGDVHLHTTYTSADSAIRFHTRTGANKATNNERLTIAGGGNVGIGAATPAKPLHISSADNQPLRVESTDAYSGIELKDNGSATLPPLISGLSNDLIFYGGHASTRPEIMRLTSSGTITLTGNTTSTGNISISAASGNPYVSIKTAGTGNNPYTEYRAGNNTVFDTMGVFSATTDRFRIGYGASGTVNTEILSVLSDGRVGINKDAPNAHSQLHIAHGPYAFLTLEATNSGGRQYEMFSYATDSSLHFYDRTLDKYRLTIDATGEVGIGTTTPTENLHISSDVSGDHTRVHIVKTTNAGTAGVSMNSYTPSHTWTIFQNDDASGQLNFYNGLNGKYPLILTKDGIASMNVTPLAWYANQSMFQIGAQMTLHSENGSSTSNSAHMSLNAQLDTDGSWEYILSNQATNYYQYEGGHYWRQTTAGTAGNDISWYDTMSLAPDTGVLKLRPVGYTNPVGHAALNIGRAGGGETRAIDIIGSWSSNENKSITFNYSSGGSDIVGQINCIHYSPASAIRWGKLYHSGNSSTYSMELRSVSTTTARLIINNSNIPGDAPINVQAGASNTGCFVGRSSVYTNPYGLLPWAGGRTYISSGTHYTNGTWQYSQSTATNLAVCLLSISGDNGIRWYAGDTTASGGNPTSWNHASDVQLFTKAGVMVASTSSDRRLKDNITNLDSTHALTKLKALQAVSFEWNDTIKTKKGIAYPEGIQYGFIAQDVKEVWPDAHIISDYDEYDEDSPTHTMNKNDTYYGEIQGVRQEKLIPLLVESIKAQQAMIETLQAEIKALKGE
mgnify:CR=1 FL=1